MDTTSDTTAHQDFSFLSLIQHADPVVQAVILGLFICSIASWAIIIAKIGRLRIVASEIDRLERVTREQSAQERLSQERLTQEQLVQSAEHDVDRANGGLAKRLLAAARQEFADLEADGARPGEARSRLTAAMRDAAVEQLKALEWGLPFLATIGSAAPFIGLFGTVWGIMHSFTSIAQARDTSLAVVAPGIAEALFATAVGLFAAIPAVIAYNQFATSLGRASDRIASVLPGVARALLLGRQPDGRRKAALR
jgi:TolQ protein